MGSQGVHAAPPVPQVATERAVQVEPTQQPLGQPVPSQTQLPETQCCPAPHGGWVPHWHRPVTEQVSARTASQGVQGAPPTPQAAAVAGTRHVSPEQHPAAQVDELHPLQAPPVHVWGEGHD